MDVKFRQFQFKVDIDWLYNVYIDKHEANLFIHDFTFSTKEEFEKIFLQRVLNEYYCFYIICDSDNTNLGFVYGHDFHNTDLHIKFSMYILPEFRALGVGAISAIRFVDMLFSQLPIKKVYETIFSTNKISLENNLKAGFIKEAILKNYIFSNGKFSDLIFLSVTRERFYKRYKRNILLIK